MSVKIPSKRDNSSEFWDKFWKDRLNKESLGEYYQKFKKSPFLVRAFEKYLPKEGKIIDAGCGSGVWTHWLRQKGYNVEGFDVSEEVVHSINKALPELPIKVGSIFKLDYPDNSCMGYLSLGVIGYFDADKPLEEASRVLKKDGIIILRVPYLTFIRSLKNQLGLYNKNKKNSPLLYVFSKVEFIKKMKIAGFDTIKITPTKFLFTKDILIVGKKI